MIILFSTKCFLLVYMYIDLLKFKGGYLDFSHLSESRNVYITEIYMKKKKIKSSIIRNHKITNKKNYYVPLKGYVASEVISRFRSKNEKCIVGISSD